MYKSKLLGPGQLDERGIEISLDPRRDRPAATILLARPVDPTAQALTMFAWQTLRNGGNDGTKHLRLMAALRLQSLF